MKRGSLLLLLSLLTIGMPAGAQECTREDSYQSCFGKFNPPADEAVADQNAERTEDAVATAATGLTNLVSPSESSLKDFLTLFAASIENATTSEEGNAFTFDWNPRLNVGKGMPAVVKLQASFAEAGVNEEVTKRLAEDAETLSELDDTLEFGDDTTISASVQWNSERHGRSIAPHRDIYQEMVLAVLDDADDGGDEIRLRYGITSQNDETSFEILKTQRGMSDAAMQAMIDDIEEEARAFQQEGEAFTGFHSAFAQLLNNQPQYYFSALHHSRRNIVGPNEWTVEATYEFAGQNLNAFRKDTEECNTPQKVRARASGCAADLQEYALKSRGGIERIAIAAEYHRSNRRWVADPDAGLEFGYPASDSFVGTLSLGAFTRPFLPLNFLGTSASSVGDARFDLTVKYEKPADDGSDAQGFVGALTYTQKISATFSLPLSFVYSDHESDLLNVDKRFSARFGLMYKLPDLKALGLAK
jgi:hypothetical protein